MRCSRTSPLAAVSFIVIHTVSINRRPISTRIGGLANWDVVRVRVKLGVWGGVFWDVIYIYIFRLIDARRCSEVMRPAKDGIRRNLHGKRGRQRQPGANPMTVKDSWTKDSIDKAVRESQTTQRVEANSTLV